MSIEQARENLIYTMEMLESVANNSYYEDGQDLIDKTQFIIEDTELYIQRCKDALEEYKEALESEDDEDEVN